MAHKMQFLSRSLAKPRRRSHCHQRLFYCSIVVDSAAAKYVRDRGLDHAVEREKHLKPLINVKDLIKSEPAKSLPLSIISQQKGSLQIPTRPIDLIRKYPSVFEEFLPGGIGIHPHIKLTQQVLDLDAEEHLVYQSENYRQDVANRLSKLLMLLRIHKIPVKILDSIKWDLGLPHNYLESIVPEFPDCFRVIGSKNFSGKSELELVCWSDELAVSFIEKKAKSGKLGYERGMPIAFPAKSSASIAVDQKSVKWFAEWQKLPYISPYENASPLGPSSDESDKWTVGVLHELLNLFISKKLEKETLLCLGEWLGIRSRIKRALLYHPWIFYMSSKIGTDTVVLRDAYKRGLLIEKNPLMTIRNRYIHLMNMAVENHKATTVPGVSKQKEKKTAQESKGQGEKEDSKGGGEENDEGSGFEHDSDDDSEEETGNKLLVHKNASTSGEVAGRKKNLNSRKPSRVLCRKRSEKRHDKNYVPTQNLTRKLTHEGHNFHASSQEKLTSPITKRMLLTEKRTPKFKGKLLRKRTATS